VQTPVAAGLAWYIAHTLLGHHQPFFAPTAAAVSLSKNRVLRGQRALQLIAGVVLGIGIGTAVKAVAGPIPGGFGAVAIGVAAAIALLAALAVGGGFFANGVLFVNQSATSAILMIAVAGTATGPERLSDALIGGGVTLVITVVLFPAAPLPLIQHAVQQVFAALRDTLARLAELAGTGRTADPEWALAIGSQGRGAACGPFPHPPFNPYVRFSRIRLTDDLLDMVTLPSDSGSCPRACAGPARASILPSTGPPARRAGSCRAS
jgi:uncharacterized membrane protein YgaE (UPF0421/DUF939 family)